MLGFGNNDSSMNQNKKYNDPSLNIIDKEETPQHLPIFSFLIKCGQRFLHYNYVCAILNDLFGIQARGGCQCSGPYSQSLLGLTTWRDDGQEVPNQTNEKVEYALLHYKERAELLRPGYTRLSLPFKGLKQEEVDYVIQALEWVAKNGWSMMCLYRCNHRTGEWRHFSRQGKPLGRSERRWLSYFDTSYGSQNEISKESYKNNTNTNNDLENSICHLSTFLDKSLANADAQLDIVRNDQRYVAQAIKMTDESNILGNNTGDDEELDELRWYVYPKECAKLLKDGATVVPDTNGNFILGAIRPRGYFDPIEDNYKPQKSIIKDDDDEPTNFRLDEIVEEKNDTIKEGTMDKSTLDSYESKNTSSRYFRDGEHHSGEATIEDIQTGYDEGELSDLAEIFEVESNGWVQIGSFLSQKETKFLKDIDLSDKDNDGPLPISTKGTSQNDRRDTDTYDQDQFSNEKKPSRNSSAWGQGAQNHIPVHNVHNFLQHDHNSNGKQCDITTEQSNLHCDPLDGEVKKTSKMTNKKKKNASKFKPPTKMMRSITQAMLQWDMVKDGDRLLLGLSGGKDSLSLLHCLLEFQKKLPIKFDIEVCTIDPMTPSFDPSPMIPYVKSLGLKYHYIRDDIVSRANTAGKDGKIVSSLCAFCARMKRGNLYNCARENNCNKLVLAQHLDDCAESFLMSVFHNGFLRTMKAHYQINAGDLSVIRPMIYCRESLMTEFSKTANLPVINENCPACFEEPKERARIKKLLSREETLHSHLYDNIRRSLIPLFHDDATAIMRSYTEEAISKSRKVEKKKKIADDRRSKKIDIEVNAEKSAPIKQCATQGINNRVDISNNLLDQLSDDDLVKELARRRVNKSKLSGSYQRLAGDDADPTGQVCTLDGKGGTIPCRELME